MPSNDEYRVFDRTAFPRERPEPQAPTVNFSSSTGVIYFSKRACDMMGLESGDRVEMLQSTRDALVLGFRKTDNPMGFKVRPKKVGQCFSAVGLVRNVLLQFGRSANTTVQLASKPDNGIYWMLRSSIDHRG